MKVKSITELSQLNKPPSELVEKLTQRYDVDDRWREAWTKLSKKHKPGKLQIQQEKIESRGVLANLRIKNLMLQYDAACSSTE